MSSMRKNFMQVEYYWQSTERNCCTWRGERFCSTGFVLTEDPDAVEIVSDWSVVVAGTTAGFTPWEAVGSGGKPICFVTSVMTWEVSVLMMGVTFGNTFSFSKFPTFRPHCTTYM